MWHEYIKFSVIGGFVLFQQWYLKLHYTYIYILVGINMHVLRVCTSIAATRREAAAGPPSLDSMTRDTWDESSAIFGRADALLILADAASALAALHAAGICHGDVYGHNLLLPPSPEAAKARGSACIPSDFGAAFFYNVSEAGVHPLERIEARALGVLVSEILERAEADYKVGRRVSVLTSDEREKISIGLQEQKTQAWDRAKSLGISLREKPPRERPRITDAAAELRTCAQMYLGRELKIGTLGSGQT